MLQNAFENFMPSEESCFALSFKINQKLSATFETCSVIPSGKMQGKGGKTTNATNNSVIGTIMSVKGS